MQWILPRCVSANFIKLVEAKPLIKSLGIKNKKNQVKNRIILKNHLNYSFGGNENDNR